MSVHNFLLKLFIFTAINDLHAHINNIYDTEDNTEHFIEYNNAPSTRYIHRRPDFDEITDNDDLKNELKRELLRRIRDYSNVEGTPNFYRPAKRRLHPYGRRSRPHSPSVVRPHLESGWGRRENRRNGDSLYGDATDSHRGWNFAKMYPDKIYSDKTVFNNKWPDIEIDPDHTIHQDSGKLDINTLPEKQERITNYRRKPIIKDSSHRANWNQMNVNHLLRSENKAVQAYKRWYHNRKYPDNTHSDKFDVTLNTENEGTVTTHRWIPTGIYSQSGKKIMRTENEEDFDLDNRWKLIGIETDSNSDNIEINKLLELDNKEKFSNDASSDSNLVLTDDDFKKIKKAIELNWSNVNPEEVVEIFKTYWYKLVVMIEKLNGSSDKIERDYLLRLLETMKKSIISNPKYIITYLQTLPKLKEHEESDNQIIHHSHETPKNKLPVDMTPHMGLIRKICEGVNQNVEDFWKIFYTYFGKQPNRYNLQELEKLYLILTIFTQINKAVQLGLPVEKYVDQINKIIEPDVHSLGPILNIDGRPSKLNANTSCVNCNREKIKDIVNGLIEKKKVTKETAAILAKPPNYNSEYYIPKVDIWHVLDNENVATEKNIGKPNIITAIPAPHIAHVEETNTLKPILGSNKLEFQTSKPSLSIKESNYLKQNHPLPDKSIKDWKNKPVLDKHNVENYAIEQDPIKYMNPIPHSDNLETQTRNPMRYLNNLEANTVNPIQGVGKPDRPSPDLHDLHAKTIKPLPHINTKEKITVKPLPDLEDLRSETVKPIARLYEIEEITKDQIPNLHNLGVKTIKPMQDLDQINKQTVKPTQSEPNIMMPEYSTETYFHVTPDEEEDGSLSTTTKYGIDPEVTSVKPLPDQFNENAGIMKDPKNIDHILRAKVISLKKYIPDIGIEEIKNIVEQGKPLPEHKEKNNGHNDTQIISPFGPFFNSWLSLVQSFNSNLLLPKPLRNDEYVVQTNSDNRLNSPEIENLILSKNVPNPIPIDKFNNENNIPIMDKNDNNLIEKLHLHPNFYLVDILRPQNKPSNQLEAEMPTSVDIVSNKSVEFIAVIIVGYLKGLIRNLGLDNLMSSINFDLIVKYLVLILLELFKTLTAKGISVNIIKTLVPVMQDKVRLFQSSELQNCLRKIFSMVSDIMISILETIKPNLPK